MEISLKRRVFSKYGPVLLILQSLLAIKKKKKSYKELIAFDMPDVNLR